MKISIVIPVFNRENLITYTMDCISNQSFENWQCILVDDGSTDKTWDKINRSTQGDNRFELYRRPNNIPKGPSGCRNFGLNLADGELIHFFDSDDILMKDFYRQIVQIFSTHSFDFVATRVALFENNIRNICKNYPPLEKDDFLLRGIEGTNMFFTQNIIWRRKYLKETNELWDETLSMCEDFDFDMRNFLKTEKFQIRNDLFVFLRKHEDSLSRTPGKSHEINRILDQIYVLKKLAAIFNQSAIHSKKTEHTILIKLKQLIGLLIKKKHFKRSLFQSINYVSRRMIRKKKFNELLLFQIGTIIRIGLSYLSYIKRI